LLGEQVLRGFVVDGGQRGDVVEEGGHQGVVIGVIGVVREVRLLSQHHILGVLRRGGQHAPVDVGAITQVRVLDLLGRQLQDPLDDVLALLRLLEE
jgi:hypothetical protein